MKKISSISFMILAPFAAFGQGAGSVEGTVDKIGKLVQDLIPIAFALALLFFFYGLAMFILKSGEDKESGKQIMIWGVIALFVMTSIYGIIDFIGQSIGIQDKGGEIEVIKVKGLGS